ncbi:MAG: GNAT family N-acetyltransferase [Chromatiales bacterium]
MEIELSAGGPEDLDAANEIVRRALRTWDLPERVKRLSEPLYLYGPGDLDALDLVLAARHGRLVGVAAWEPASRDDTPGGRGGLLLHGIYVDPDAWGSGVGKRLLEAAHEAAGKRGLDGVLVKAQRGAEGFFLGRGFERLPVNDPSRDYPYRLWLALGTGPA